MYVFLIFIFLFPVVFKSNSDDECSEPVLNVLEEFYTSTGGAAWEKKDGWFENNNCCSWFGTDCDSGRYLSKLDFSNYIVRH